MAEADIRRTIGAIEKTAERVIKRLGFAIHGELTKANPVDTTWSRANWIVSIGSPITRPAASKGNVGAAIADQSASLSRLLVYKLNQGTIFIQNGVPYVPRLNEGHSKQAAAGWIERAIDAGVAQVTRGAI